MIPVARRGNGWLWKATAAAMMLTTAGGSRLAAEPPSGGTIAIQPKTADGDYDAAMPSFVNAIGEALATKGFTILDDDGHAAYVGELILGRADVGTGTAKASGGGAAVQPGGAAGVGAGVTIPLSTGRSRLVPIQRTRVELRIHKRGDAAVVWDAAAVTIRETGTRKGGSDQVAADLSEALLRSYPGQPTEDVGVP